MCLIKEDLYAPSGRAGPGYPGPGYPGPVYPGPVYSGPVYPGPVYLVVVGFVGEELRAHVVRRSDQGAGHVVLVLQDPGDAQVSHLDDVGLGQEDVLGLQVPVEDVLLMQILFNQTVCIHVSKG